MVLSWIVSPILSGIIVAIMYGLIRTFVLRSKHSFTRTFYVSSACCAVPSCVHLLVAVFCVICAAYTANAAGGLLGSHANACLVTG